MKYETDSALIPFPFGDLAILCGNPAALALPFSTSALMSTFATVTSVSRFKPFHAMLGVAVHDRIMAVHESVRCMPAWWRMAACCMR